MENAEFEEIVNRRIESIKSVLTSKGQEYGREDRLHNFKVAGRRLGCSPERALIGMKEKHCVSVMDIVNDIDKNIITTMDRLNEKIGDEINYLILLEALITERITNKAEK